MSLLHPVRFALAMLFMVNLGIITSASAQVADDAGVYERTLEAAVAAHRARQWEEARTLFERAHALYPNARTLRGMGICAFEAGHYALALRDLEAALEHPQRPLPADLRPFVEELVTHLRSQLAAYLLALEPSTAELRIDDTAPVLNARGEVLLEPGLHHASVALAGYVTQTMEIDAHAGDRQELRVMLSPVPEPESTPPVPSPEQAVFLSETKPAPGPLLSAAPPTDTMRRWPALRPSAIATSGLAVLSFATTGALYGAAQGRMRDVASECRRLPGNGCTPEQGLAKKREKDVPRLEHGMTATLAVGAVLAATSVVLWVLDARGRRKLARQSEPTLALHF